MKKILLSTIYMVVCILSLQAQTLFGTTSIGGNGGGTINKFIPATNNLTVAHSFGHVDHTPGYSHLIRATDGKLYGVAGGGKNNNGVLFSYDPSTGIYLDLKDFDSTNAAPTGSLIQASDGKLYGMTAGGGSGGYGVIFSFDPSSSTYTKLKDFDYVNNGGYHSGSLIQASDGKLYGLTSNGGSGDAGVVFSFNPLTSAYIKLKEFNYTDGANPEGSLVQGSDGKLYGMTSNTYDGSTGRGAGVIFSVDPATSTYTRLKDFDYATGAHPKGSLIQASDGKLYGMTPYSGYDDDGDGTIGYGVIFSFVPSSSTYTVEKYFDPATGDEPYGDLIQAGDGKLYGLTSAGGSGPGSGVIFSFNPSSSTYTKLTDFDITNGSLPLGSLMQANDGKLYGMTSEGGSTFFNQGQIKGAGVIFSLDPVASTYTKLHDFGSNEEGNTVSAKLVKASDGKLYGETIGGGSKGAGVIFSFDPSGSTYTKLKDFDITNGAYPYGSLIQASDGKLYGITKNGGSSDSGVIFSFDPSSAIYSKLKDFNHTDGTQPVGSLVQASNGKLYGMTSAGGNNSVGVIFSFDPTSSGYTKLRDFDYAGGETPAGSLIQASNGKLYGMTINGGSTGGGTIFLLDPLTTAYAVLWNFNNASGANPPASLMQASDGNLYGMAPQGGNGLNGVIFTYNPVSHIYTKLADFDNINGAYPYGSLIQASDEKLYGTTISGGSSNLGVVFSFDLSTSGLTKLQDFNSTNGGNPSIGSAFIEVAESGPLPVILISFTGKNIGNVNQLSWKVGNEQNLNYYELQRSIDGQNFKAISQIKATGNNSYAYNDHILTQASLIYFYRLKSVDKDGKITYSEVIKIRTAPNGFVTVNPNPFKDKLVVNIESLTRDKATFTIADVSGRKLYKEDKVLYAGTNVVEINETRRLSKGTYLLTIISSQQTQSIKVVKGN